MRVIIREREGERARERIDEKKELTSKVTIVFHQSLHITYEYHQYFYTTSLAYGSTRQVLFQSHHLFTAALPKCIQFLCSDYSLQNARKNNFYPQHHFTHHHICLNQTLPMYLSQQLSSRPFLFLLLRDASLPQRGLEYEPWMQLPYPHFLAQAPREREKVMDRGKQKQLRRKYSKEEGFQGKEKKIDKHTHTHTHIYIFKATNSTLFPSHLSQTLHFNSRSFKLNAESLQLFFQHQFFLRAYKETLRTHT